jgi:hypothetical protein
VYSGQPRARRSKQVRHCRCFVVGQAVWGRRGARGLGAALWRCFVGRLYCGSHCRRAGAFFRSLRVRTAGLHALRRALDLAALACRCHRHAPDPAVRRAQTCAGSTDAPTATMVFEKLKEVMAHQLQDGARSSYCTVRRAANRRRPCDPARHSLSRGRSCTRPAGENFANIVLNNETCCCFTFGPMSDAGLNDSLPNMPPALVGKLDKRTWETLVDAMNDTGSSNFDKVLQYFTCLTCTVRPALHATVLAAAALMRRCSLRPRSGAASCLTPSRALSVPSTSEWRRSWLSLRTMRP